MIFSSLKLPAKLQRAATNLSATVQTLLTEIILYAEGFDDRARSEGGKLDYAMRNKRATALLSEQLKTLLTDDSADDVAIGVASLAGRSTKEIAEFLGLQQHYVMRRLCAIRKVAAKTKPAEEEKPKYDATILELFAEAQRK